MRVPIRIVVIAPAVALALGGCTRSGAGGAGNVIVDEKANGHTVRISRGGTIDVVLHSTYWKFSPLAGAGVLKPNGAPEVAASPAGSGCVPGGGCGTVTAAFTAIGDGVAEVRASRTSCGEALRCTPDQASFLVTVVVGGESATATALAPATPTATAVPGSPSAAPATVIATEADNGRTATLKVGDQLVVRLASTYWQLATLSTDTVLSSLGPPSVTATPPGGGCVPGAGCGTVTARFAAVGTGRVTVAADRTSCGEARMCTGTEGAYRLSVYVVIR
jgi:hypothetical protein